MSAIIKQIEEYLTGISHQQLKTIQNNCVLIRNCLSIDEQLSLYAAVNKASKYNNTSKVTQSLKNSTTATKLMNININNSNHNDRMSPIFMELQSRIKNIVSLQTDININCECKETFIKSLEYHVTNGRLDKHCDGVNGWVFIYSLGNIANFFVNDTEFEFCSGDVLIFDSSKKAKIFHGVRSIKANSCPKYLTHDLRELRISVQIRLQMPKKWKVKSDRIRELMMKLDDLR